MQNKVINVKLVKMIFFAAIKNTSKKMLNQLLLTKRAAKLDL